MNFGLTFALLNDSEAWRNNGWTYDSDDKDDDKPHEEHSAAAEAVGSLFGKVMAAPFCLIGLLGGRDR